MQGQSHYYTHSNYAYKEKYTKSLIKQSTSKTSYQNNITLPTKLNNG